MSNSASYKYVSTESEEVELVEQNTLQAEDHGITCHLHLSDQGEEEGAPRPDLPVFDTTEGSATICSEVVSIAKNLLGAGVLSMSGGIAMFANDPRAVLTGIVWTVSLAAMFGYFCVLIAKVCHITKSVTIRSCWERSLGSRGAVTVLVVITMNVSGPFWF